MNSFDETDNPFGFFKSSSNPMTNTTHPPNNRLKNVLISIKEIWLSKRKTIMDIVSPDIMPHPPTKGMLPLCLFNPPGLSNMKRPSLRLNTYIKIKVKHKEKTPNK